jgi:hypothetical protein
MRQGVPLIRTCLVPTEQIQDSEASEKVNNGTLKILFLILSIMTVHHAPIV